MDDASTARVHAEPARAGLHGLSGGADRRDVGQRQDPFIDARDIAAVAAAALTRSGHDWQKYILTGPEALSYYDIARILSDVTGRPVEYHDLFDEARERMTRAGAAPASVEGNVALATHQRAGGKTAMVHDTVRQILGRAPRSFAEFAKDHAHIFRGEREFEAMP